MKVVVHIIDQMQQVGSTWCRGITRECDRVRNEEELSPTIPNDHEWLGRVVIWHNERILEGPYEQGNSCTRSTDQIEQGW